MKRLLQYLMVFLIVFLASAGTMVMVYKVSGDSDSYGLLAGGETDTSDPILDGMVSKTLATKNMNLTIHIRGEYQGTTIDLTGNVLLQVTPTLKVDANLFVVYQDQQLPIYLHYEESTAYLSLLGQNIKINTSHLLDSLQPLLSILKPYINNLDLSFLDALGLGNLEELDISSLTSLLQYVHTSEREGGYQLEFLVEDLIHATILLDETYTMEKVIIEPTTIAGITFSLDVDMVCNAEDFSIPAVKQDTYLDISNAYHLVSMLLGYQGYDAFQFYFEGELFGYMIDGSIAITTNNGFALQFQGTINGKTVEIIVVEDHIYVSIGSIHIEATIEEIQKMMQTYFPQLVLPTISLDTLAIQEIIQNIEQIDGGIKITLAHYGTILLQSDADGKLNDIDWQWQSHHIHIGFETWNTPVQQPQGSFTSMTTVVSYLDTIMDIMEEKQIAGQFSATYQDITVSGNIIVDWNAGIQLYISTTLFGQPIEVWYQEEVVYLHLDGVYIKTTWEEVQSYLAKYGMKIELPTVSIDKIDFATLDILSILDSLHIIVWNDTQFQLSYQGLQLNIARDNQSLSTIAVSYLDKIHAVVNLQPMTIPTVEKEAYLSLESIDILAQHIMTVIDQKTVVGQVELCLQDQTYLFDIALDLRNGLNVEIHTTMQGYQLGVVLQNGLLTLSINNIVVSTQITTLTQLFDILSNDYHLPVEDIQKVLETYLPNGEIALPQLSISTDQIVQFLQTLTIDSLQLQQEKYQYSLSGSAMGQEIRLVYSAQGLERISYHGVADMTMQIDWGKQPSITSLPSTVQVEDVLPFVQDFAQFYQEKQAKGTLDIQYQDLEVQVDFELDARQMTSLNDIKNLKAKVVTQFYGLDIEAILDHATVYMTVAGLRIAMGLDEIPMLLEWINARFGTDFKLPSVSTSDLSLDSLDSITTKNNTISFSFLDQFMLTLSRQESWQVQLSAPQLSIKAGVVWSPVMIEVDPTQFQHYTMLTQLIDSIMDIIETKQVSVSANATVYEENSIQYVANCQLEMDWQNTFALFGEAKLTGLQDMEFNLAYEDKMLYVNYNKLKVKMSQDCLKELAYILASVLGIDTSKLDFLQDVAQDMQLDLENLQQLIPSFDPTQPLMLLTYIKKVSFHDSILTITLYGSKLSGVENSQDVTIDIITNDHALSGIIIKDFYSGVTPTEKFDLSIFVNEFQGVQQLPDKEQYMDLSDCAPLVKAFIDTSSLQYFHITATLDITMEVLSLSNAISMSVPVDLAIRLRDQKPEIMLTVGPIPVIAPIDNDVPYVFGDTISGVNCGKDRILKVYFADGYVYFYRSENIPRFASSDRKYEKKLKMTLEEFLADPMILLSYGCGFQDIIMDEIQVAVDKAMNRTTPLDMSNILLGFGKTDNTYELILNLAELANNSDLDTITIRLTTSPVDQKEYIVQGELEVHMPISSAFKIDIASTDLTLNAIGQEIDFAEMENYINSYPYKVDEYWHASNGNWTLASATVYTVNFEENGGQEIENVIGAIDTVYTLPTLPNKVVETDTDKTIYTFDGWYTTPTFEGEKYTKTVITRGDLTLYAKWVEKEAYRTIFYYVDDQLIDQYYGLVGSAIKENTLQDRILIQGNQKLFQTFDCWTDQNGDKITLIPSVSQNLYARFITTYCQTSYTLQFVTDHGESLPTMQCYEQDTVSLPSWNTIVENTDGTTITYHFLGWYVDPEYREEFTGMMPSHDLTIYAQWEVLSIVKERSLTILDQNEIVYQGLWKVGDVISLPDRIKIDEFTKWYLDAEYTQVTTYQDIMPDQDLVLHIRNRYRVTYTYYENVDQQHTQYTKTLDLYQGETFQLPEQVEYSIDYQEGGKLAYRMIYHFLGYQENGQFLTNFVMSNTDRNIVSVVEEERKNWYVVSFNLGWVKPSAWIDKNSAFQGKITCVKAPNTVENIYVLEGDTIDPSLYTSYCTYTYQCVWITDSYDMRVVTWNTTGASNVLVSNVQNKEYTVLTEIVVTSDMTLYATWGADL